MDFGLTEEQKLIVETTRAFVENELYPHEQEVERTGVLRPELIETLKAKAIEAGLYAANMPTDVGGAGLDHGELAALREGTPAAPIMRCTGPAWRGHRTSCSPARRNSAKSIFSRASAARSRTASP